MTRKKTITRVNSFGVATYFARTTAQVGRYIIGDDDNFSKLRSAHECEHIRAKIEERGTGVWTNVLCGHGRLIGPRVLQPRRCIYAHKYCQRFWNAWPGNRSSNYEYCVMFALSKWVFQRKRKHRNKFVTSVLTIEIHSPALRISTMGRAKPGKGPWTKTILLIHWFVPYNTQILVFLERSHSLKLFPRVEWFMTNFRCHFPAS